MGTGEDMKISQKQINPLCLGLLAFYLFLFVLKKKKKLPLSDWFVSQ